jgi:hypothetical protein
MDALRAWGVYYLDLYKPTSRDAVMFDIDDTLIRSSDGMVMFPIVDILLHARDSGYKVILITARPRLQDVIEYTRDQMHDLGIPYDELGFCNAEDKGKLKMSLGYRFVLSVGDLWTDLTHTRHGLNTRTYEHF